GVARGGVVAGDVRGDGERRDTGAPSVVEAVDEVEVARSAAAGTHGALAGQCCLTAGCEGGGLLVADMDPFELRVDPQRAGEAVERISGDAVDAFASAGHEGIDDGPGYGGHAIPSIETRTPGLRWCEPRQGSPRGEALTASSVQPRIPAPRLSASSRS